jgi:cytochrome c oxidase assembly factor 5
MSQLYPGPKPEAPVTEAETRNPTPMSNFCEPLLAALKDCVLHSDCVIKEGRLPSECIKHHIDELPEECRSLRLAAFECKRGMVSFPSQYPALSLF